MMNDILLPRSNVTAFSCSDLPECVNRSENEWCDVLGDKERRANETHYWALKHFLFRMDEIRMGLKGETTRVDK